MEAVAQAIGDKAITRPTRVVMVAPPSSGGLARHVAALLEGLAGEGYEVGVVCPAEGLIAESARAHGMPVYPINLAGPGPSATLVSVVQAARAVGALQANIIHSHSFRAGLVGTLVAAGAPAARLVATIHGFPPQGAADTARRSPRSWERWAVRTLLRRADRVIAVSEALRCELIRMRRALADRCLVIPNGVDTSAEPMEPAAARQSLGLEVEGPLVGMVARLAPGKEIAEFLECCQLVSARCPSARFLLAGGGPLSEEAAATTQRLGIGHRLHLLGEVKSAREVIAALDVLVIASTSEGSSMVAMEAMAQSRPVVATTVGGLPEVVTDEETGLLVPPAEPEALARAVLRLLDDPALARNMGSRGRTRARKCFDKRQMVARVKEVYAEAMREELNAGGRRR